MIEKIFSKDALLLAGFTAAAYFYAFIFEYGYVRNFGVPIRLETVTTQSILLASSTFLIAIVAWGPAANSLFDFAANQKIRAALFGLGIVLMLLGTAILDYTLEISIWYKVFMTCCAVIPFINIIVLPLLQKKEQEGYIKKIKRRIEETQTANTLPPKLMKLIGPNYYGVAVVSLIAFPAFAFLLGIWVASSQRGFLTTERDGTWLYVTGSQDQMIFSGFDASTNSLNGKLLILRGKELEALSLQNVLLPEPPKHWQVMN